MGHFDANHRERERTVPVAITTITDYFSDLKTGVDRVRVCVMHSRIIDCHSFRAYSNDNRFPCRFLQRRNGT